jgi:hypothetical protein
MFELNLLFPFLDHSFFDAFVIQIRIIQTCGETDEERPLTLGDRMKLFDPSDKKNRICGEVGWESLQPIFDFLSFNHS